MLEDTALEEALLFQIYSDADSDSNSDSED